MHRFFLSLADVFLGYWIALVSNYLLPLQLLLGIYHIFFYYAEFIKLCTVLLCLQFVALWHKTMFIVDILSNMSNIIKYYKAWHFPFKNSSCWSSYSKSWFANVLVTPSAVPIHFRVLFMVGYLPVSEKEENKKQSIEQKPF